MELSYVLDDEEVILTEPESEEIDGNFYMNRLLMLGTEGALPSSPHSNPASSHYNVSPQIEVLPKRGTKRLLANQQVDENLQIYASRKDAVNMKCENSTNMDHMSDTAAPKKKTQGRQRNKVANPKKTSEENHQKERPKPNVTKETKKKRQNSKEAASKKRVARKGVVLPYSSRGCQQRPRDKLNSSPGFCSIAIKKQKTGKGPSMNSIHKRNMYGETRLHLAVQKGAVQSVEDMIKCGTCVNLTDNAGWTPLHEGVLHNHYSIVESLLKAGAQVDPAGYNGITPLQDAVLLHNLKITDLLLKHGADPLLKNHKGEAAIDINKDSSMQNLLRKYLPVAKTNCLSDQNVSIENEIKEPEMKPYREARQSAENHEATTSQQTSVPVEFVGPDAAETEKIHDREGSSTVSSVQISLLQEEQAKDVVIAGSLLIHDASLSNKDLKGVVPDTLSSLSSDSESDVTVDYLEMNSSSPGHWFLSATQNFCESMHRLVGEIARRDTNIKHKDLNISQSLPSDASWSKGSNRVIKFKNTSKKALHEFRNKLENGKRQKIRQISLDVKQFAEKDEATISQQTSKTEAFVGLDSGDAERVHNVFANGEGSSKASSVVVIPGSLLAQNVVLHIQNLKGVVPDTSEASDCESDVMVDYIQTSSSSPGHWFLSATQDFSESLHRIVGEIARRDANTKHKNFHGSQSLSPNANNNNPSLSKSAQSDITFDNTSKRAFDRSRMDQEHVERKKIRPLSCESEAFLDYLLNFDLNGVSVANSQSGSIAKRGSDGSETYASPKHSNICKNPLTDPAVCQKEKCGLQIQIASPVELSVSILTPCLSDISVLNVKEQSKGVDSVRQPLSAWRQSPFASTETNLESTVCGSLSLLKDTFRIHDQGLTCSPESQKAPNVLEQLKVIDKPLNIICSKSQTSSKSGTAPTQICFDADNQRQKASQLLNNACGSVAMHNTSELSYTNIDTVNNLLSKEMLSSSPETATPSLLSNGNPFHSQSDRLETPNKQFQHREDNRDSQRSYSQAPSSHTKTGDIVSSERQNFGRSGLNLVETTSDTENRITTNPDVSATEPSSALDLACVKGDSKDDKNVDSAVSGDSDCTIIEEPEPFKTSNTNVEHVECQLNQNDVPVAIFCDKTQYSEQHGLYKSPDEQGIGQQLENPADPLDTGTSVSILRDLAEKPLCLLPTVDNNQDSSDSVKEHNPQIDVGNEEVSYTDKPISQRQNKTGISTKDLWKKSSKFKISKHTNIVDAVMDQPVNVIPKVTYKKDTSESSIICEEKFLLDVEEKQKEMSAWSLNKPEDREMQTVLNNVFFKQHAEKIQLNKDCRTAPDTSHVGQLNQSLLDFASRQKYLLMLLKKQKELKHNLKLSTEQHRFSSNTTEISAVNDPQQTFTEKNKENNIACQCNYTTTIPSHLESQSVISHIVCPSLLSGRPATSDDASTGLIRKGVIQPGDNTLELALMESSILPDSSLKDNRRKACSVTEHKVIPEHLLLTESFSPGNGLPHQQEHASELTGSSAEGSTAKETIKGIRSIRLIRDEEFMPCYLMDRYWDSFIQSEEWIF